ncbi:MAG: class I SAM-dependent methyltransferase [Candidatus Bathyarchaeia archaeon]
MYEVCCLDVGCGNKKLTNSIGVDFRKTEAVDVIADVRKLPFRDRSIDRVYSRYVIEHFSWRKVGEVLAEWSRVLKVGGVMELICPDLRTRCLLFFIKPSMLNLRGIYGGQDYEGNVHMCGFDYKMLRFLLSLCGLRVVKRMRNGLKWKGILPLDIHVVAIKER